MVKLAKKIAILLYGINCPVQCLDTLILPACGGILNARLGSYNLLKRCDFNRRLLRLLDAQNALLAESKLMSFTAGFKLAWGMAKELEADGLYSFEREEEEHICRPAEQVDA